MEHVGVVVDDLGAATAFFVELGLELQGAGQVEGGWATARSGWRASVWSTRWWRPGPPGRLELVKVHSPRSGAGDGHPPANVLGIRHVAFAVDDIDAAVAAVRARGGELVGEVENYEDIYRLCCVRGREGIIVELAERVG